MITDQEASALIWWAGCFAVLIVGVAVLAHLALAQQRGYRYWRGWAGFWRLLATLASAFLAVVLVIAAVILHSQVFVAVVVATLLQAAARSFARRQEQEPAEAAVPYNARHRQS